MAEYEWGKRFEEFLNRKAGETGYRTAEDRMGDFDWLSQLEKRIPKGIQVQGARWERPEIEKAIQQITDLADKYPALNPVLEKTKLIFGRYLNDRGSVGGTHDPLGNVATMYYPEKNDPGKFTLHEILHAFYQINPAYQEMAKIGYSELSDRTQRSEVKKSPPNERADEFMAYNFGRSLESLMQSSPTFRGIFNKVMNGASLEDIQKDPEYRRLKQRADSPKIEQGR